MNIRRAEEGDLEAIVRINNAEAEKTPWVGNPLEIGFFKQSLDIPLFYVAEQENQVVGFMMVMDENTPYDSKYFQWFKQRFEEFLYIDRLVVDPAKRRQGIAKKIYERLFKDHGERPITGEITIFPENAVSLEFHEKLGFQAIGTLDSDDKSKTCAMYVLY